MAERARILFLSTPSRRPVRVWISPGARTRVEDSIPYSCLADLLGARAAGGWNFAQRLDPASQLAVNSLQAHQSPFQRSDQVPQGLDAHGARRIQSPAADKFGEAAPAS